MVKIRTAVAPNRYCPIWYDLDRLLLLLLIALPLELLPFPAFSNSSSSLPDLCCWKSLVDCNNGTLFITTMLFPCPGICTDRIIGKEEEEDEAAIHLVRRSGEELYVGTKPEAAAAAVLTARADAAAGNSSNKAIRVRWWSRRNNKEEILTCVAEPIVQVCSNSV
jgi:hypothetical protein